MRMNRKGVTLIELIVAIAILAIVAGGLFSVLVSGIRSFNVNVTNAESQAGLRAAMVPISREIRKAEAVTPGAASLRMTIGGADYDYTIFGGRWLVCNGGAVAENVAGISSQWADADHKVVSVTLTASDGFTLTTQMHLKD